MATGTLTGQTIANTYKSLLKVTGTTAGGETLHATTLKVIEDGDGNPSPIQLAQNRLEIVPTSDHANAFEVSQADGTQIFNINSSTPTVTITSASTMIQHSGAMGITVGSTGAGGASISLDGDSNGDGAGGDYCYFHHDTAGILNIVQDSPSGTNEIRFGTAGTEDKVVINASGYLSVGTTSPLATFHVKHTTDDTDENGDIAMTVGGDSSGEIRHYWGVNNSSNYGYYGVVEHATAYRPLALQPNGSYVGIGEVAPVVTLDVHADTTETAAVFGQADDGNCYIATRTGEVQNQVCGYIFQVGSAALAGYGSANTLATITSQVKNDGGTLKGNLRFTTNEGDSLGGGGITMEITEEGVLELNKGQIKFPATQNASADANTLDDYEEGTWSPVICQADDLSDALAMHAETAGNYTKIGNIVHITGQAIGNSSDGDMSASDSLAIKGLPFAVPNAQKNRSTATFVGLTVNLASGKRISGYVIQNSSQINLYVNDGTSEGALRFDEFTNAGHVIFQATYLI